MEKLTSMLTTRGTHIETRDGERVHLRGVGLGGWMNMENFITGYPANESLMRAAVRVVRAVYRRLGRIKHRLLR